MPTDSRQDYKIDKAIIAKNTSDKPITVKLTKEQTTNVEFIDDTEEPYILTNDDGEEEEFIGIAVVEYQEVFYIIMKPVSPIEDMQEDEALLFKLEPEDEKTDIYLPVEDEILADEIFEIYLKALDNLD